MRDIGIGLIVIVMGLLLSGLAYLEHSIQHRKQIYKDLFTISFLICMIWGALLVIFGINSL